MQTDAKVHVNWLRFNVPSIMAILAAGLGVVTYVNQLDARLEKLEEFGATRAVSTDKSLDEVQTSITQLTNMPYRVQILEQQQLAVNLRIDRFTETISNTMELLRKDVNALSTRVEVLGTKIDALTPENRSELMMPRHRM